MANALFAFDTLESARRAAERAPRRACRPSRWRCTRETMDRANRCSSRPTRRSSAEACCATCTTDEAMRGYGFERRTDWLDA
jgi:hypothetical protein